jgi:Carboxypeptidase regulatory-like domain
MVLHPAASQAAATGTVKGRVIKAPSDSPQAGVRVTLVGGERDGSNPLHRTTITDSHGRYIFDNVPASNHRIYALNARFDGGLFAGGAIQVPSNTSKRPVIESRLRVWNTTTDPSAILITRDDLFVQQQHDGAGVVESINVQNNTNAAYIGRGADVGGSDRRPVPSLGFALPSGASRGGIAIVQSDLDIPQLLPTDFGVAATSAIPPGETRIIYSYRVQGLVGQTDISRTTLYPTVEVSVFAASPLAIQSNRLSRSGTITLDKKKYQKWTSKDPLAPGDELQAVAIARASMAPGLLIGIVAGFAVFALAGLLFYLRGRKTDRSRPATQATAPTREDVLIAIAKLDRRHENGDVAEDEWRQARAKLLSQVEHSG